MEEVEGGGRRKERVRTVLPIDFLLGILVVGGKAGGVIRVIRVIRVIMQKSTRRVLGF